MIFFGVVTNWLTALQQKTVQRYNKTQRFVVHSRQLCIDIVWHTMVVYNRGCPREQPLEMN